jgi:hypothetical protein
VLTDGFAYAGTVYASLSAVAKVITGSHCNGFLDSKMSNVRKDGRMNSHRHSTPWQEALPTNPPPAAARAFT